MTQVTYIIGTYPLLTTTFIDREIRTLRSWGVTIDVVSLRRPAQPLSPEQSALAETTTYIRPIRPLELIRRHLRFIARRPAVYFSTVLRLAGGRGQSWRERLRTVGHFGLAVHVAGQVMESGEPERLHAHFIDRAALVAHVAARLLDVPYSVTAHASDIYVAPVLLDAKIDGADFVATCTGYNQVHLANEVNGAAEKVAVLYHGLDVGHYVPGPPSSPATEPTLVSVGQLKEKKGYLHLLAAARLLADRGVEFRCEIIGEGPQRAELERTIIELGLGPRVTLLGALPHDDVIAAYRRARAFVLPCVTGGDGDRDGIPNVILEAMAMRLPVVSTSHSGIPEAVEDETTGLLVPPGDAEELARALERVLADPDAARRMGDSGRDAVIDRFDAERNVRLLYDRFTLAEAIR